MEDAVCDNVIWMHFSQAQVSREVCYLLLTITAIALKIYVSSKDRSLGLIMAFFYIISFIDILNAERVDLAVLDTSLSFLAPTLTQLTLSTARLYWSFNEINSVDSLLRTVLDTCTQLTTLSVSGNVLFSDNYMSASMETTTIKNLSLQAKYIGKLDLVLARCPHLVFLQVVQQDASAAARSVTDIVSEHCPRIQYFHYYTGQGQLIQTQRRCFAGKDKQDISSDMTVGMKELVYFGVEGNISTFLQGPLHNLHTLVITKQMILVSPGVAGLIAKMQNLERLDICGGGNQPLTLEQWINIWKGCTNVKCLTIRCLLTDADLLELPQYCKQLERLDIRYFIHAGISNQAVKGLVERITTLRYVKYWERRSKMPIEGNMIDEILASRGGYLERH